MTNEEIRAVTGAAEKKLSAAGIEAAAAEVEIILEYLLKTDRINILLYGPELIDEQTLDKFHAIVERRVTRYPLQYILGEAYFYGRRFVVEPEVMVPTPETEVLCELAVNYCRNEGLAEPYVLDMGAGSGIIAVTMALELPEVWVTAVDISAEALTVARKNAAMHDVAARVDLRRSDLFEAVRPDEKFDLILSNPPYIAEPDYEKVPPEVKADPKIAMTAGPEGLDIIRQLIAEAPSYLKENGRLMFEFGDNQAERIIEMSQKDKNYRAITIIKDLNDIDRVAILSS